MKKAIWISYDLGIGGDYDGLYRWLANHGAVECGDGLAFFNYHPQDVNSILTELKTEIEANVRVNNKTRIYCIRKVSDKIKGSFLFGSRKGNPWEGYGDVDKGVEDGEQNIGRYRILVPFPTMYELLRTKFVKNKVALREIKEMFHSGKITRCDDDAYRSCALELTLNEPRRNISMVDNIIRLMLDDKSIAPKGLITFNVADFQDVCQKNHIEILY